MTSFVKWLILTSIVWQLALIIRIGGERKTGSRRSTATATTVKTTTTKATTTSATKSQITLLGDNGFESADGSKCVDIPVDRSSLCRNIGYSRMRLPNILDHDTLDEVTSQSAHWAPLLATRCHDDLQIFLCSLLSPVCLEDTVLPCRTLCTKVKDGCEKVMLNYGFAWPKSFSCDRFPSEDDLCINGGNATQEEKWEIAGVMQHGGGNKGGGLHGGQSITAENSTCPVCQQNATLDTLQTNYCAADFVVTMKKVKITMTAQDMEMSSKTAKTIKGLTPRKGRKAKQKRPVYVLQNVTNCSCANFASNITSSTTSKAPPSLFVLMGHQDMTSKRLIVSHAYKYDKKSSEQITRALNSISRQNQCPAHQISSSSDKTAEKSGIVNRAKLDRKVKVKNNERKNRKSSKRRKYKRNGMNGKKVEENLESEQMKNRKGHRGMKRVDRKNRYDTERQADEEETVGVKQKGSKKTGKPNSVSSVEVYQQNNSDVMTPHGSTIEQTNSTTSNEQRENKGRSGKKGRGRKRKGKKAGKKEVGSIKNKNARAGHKNTESDDSKESEDEREDDDVSKKQEKSESDETLEKKAEKTKKGSTRRRRKQTGRKDQSRQGNKRNKNHEIDNAATESVQGEDTEEVNDN